MNAPPSVSRSDSRSDSRPVSPLVALLKSSWYVTPVEQCGQASSSVLRQASPSVHVNPLAFIQEN